MQYAKSIHAGLKLLDAMIEDGLAARDSGTFTSIAATVRELCEQFSRIGQPWPDAGWPERVRGLLGELKLRLSSNSPELRIAIQGLIQEMEQLHQAVE